MEVAGDKNLLIISNLPANALIELRRLDALNELREIIRDGLEKVDSVSDESFRTVMERVADNFSQAFSKHQTELKEISRSRRKFYGVDIANWLVLGGIQIAAAATSNPLLGVIGVGAGMVNTPPSARELMTQWKQNRTKGIQLKNSPIGILVRYSDIHAAP